ncbi:MAG: ABC transporter ATP-binding protein [Oscillospiraceae bacterium]
MAEKSVMSCVKAIIRKNIVLTVSLCLVALLSVAASLAPPQIMRIIIDKYLMNKDTAKLYIPAAIYLGTVVSIGVLDFLKGYFLTRFGQRTVRELRLAMMKKLTLLPSSYFTANAPGTVSSRITADVDNVNGLFSEGLVSMAVDSLKLFGIIVSIWIFSVPLALISLCLIPIVFAITRFFKNRMLAAQTKNLEQLGRVNGHIAESVKNITMIKLFSKERYMEKKYCRELNENYKTKGRVIIYDSAYAPIIQLIRAVVISIVVLLSAEQIGVLGISVGMMAATIDLISNLLVPVEALGMEIQSIQTGLSGIRRIDEFFALDEEEKDESICADAVIRGFQAGAVCFENLNFSYEAEILVLKNMSFSVANGENVTISGRTGVGKSTLFGLVMGLLKPTEGRVLIGGFDACKIPNGEKRKIFGYVEQSFRFVPGNVADQISLGDPQISRERIIGVCTELGLSESIEALPNGYDTIVTGSGTFSWGQCQLLSIARAVAAKPPILLLDEITANLDSATEEKIMSAIQSVSRGRTVLSISHRTSAMQDSDRIIHIENGEIV